MDRFAEKVGVELVSALKGMTVSQVVEFARFVVDHAAKQEDEEVRVAVLELANMLVVIANKKITNVKPRSQAVTDVGGIDSREVFGSRNRRTTQTTIEDGDPA